MPAIGGGRYCFTHAPEAAPARASAHKRGGQRQRVRHAGNAGAVIMAPRTVGETLTILDYALAETLPLENSIARGRLLLAIAAGYVDALKQGEIQAQLEEVLGILRNR